jgi:hypothetical protein
MVIGGRFRGDIADHAFVLEPVRAARHRRDGNRSARANRGELTRKLHLANQLSSRTNVSALEDEGPKLVAVLEGRLVRPEPLAYPHAPDLAVAAEEDRSSYRFTWVPKSADVTD